MRVVLGGTFDTLHVGHERLLARAFELGDEVFIGLTSQNLAQRRRARRVKSFAARKQALERLLRRKGWKGLVVEIQHPFGRAVDPRYQAIVVSPETLPRVAAINRERRRRRLPPLKIYTIPFLYGQDGLRISSTRIAAGEIDARGRRRSPLRVAVGTGNALKVRAVRSAFRAAFGRLPLRVVGVLIRSGVPEQPTEEQTFRGAQARAVRALERIRGADYGVGVEAGLIWHRELDRFLDVQYVVIMDKDGGRSAAHGGGFYYPRLAEREILRGKTVNQVLGRLARDRRVGSTTGAVGFLSRGAVDRQELTLHAVLLALVPRISRDLYQE